MNIIDVLRLPAGTKLKTSFNEKIILKVCEQDGVKTLKIDGDFKRVSLDSEVTEAEYEII